MELGAAIQMLDEEHQDLPRDPYDDNLYTFGSICGLNGSEHNIVIACLSYSRAGTESAAVAAARMKVKFSPLRFCLVVGIGGGIPSKKADIRLGDVVIRIPHMEHGGVVQHDLCTNEVFTKRHLDSPSTILLQALSKLKSNHLRGKKTLSNFLTVFSNMPDFLYDHTRLDMLFEANYSHVGGDICTRCDGSRKVERSPRKNSDVAVHYASGNAVIKDAITRDKLSAQLGGVLCVEMEAAGLMNTSCLVIKGICNYADFHCRFTAGDYVVHGSTLSVDSIRV